MSGKFCLTDYVSDIQLEVGPNFLPLPEIQIPQEDITLRVPLYEYSFSAEHKYFDFIQKNLNQRSTDTPTSTKSLEETSNPYGNGKNAYELIKLVEFPSPSPLLTNESSQQKNPEQPRIHNEFLEFEDEKNVFDLVELKCIDEKKELENLWNSFS